MSMQAWALLAVTVSDHVRLPIGARKELILTIIFFVRFGAQSGCTAEVVRGPVASARKSLLGVYFQSRVVEWFGVPSDRNTRSGRSSFSDAQTSNSLKTCVHECSRNVGAFLTSGSLQVFELAAFLEGGCDAEEIDLGECGGPVLGLWIYDPDRILPSGIRRHRWHGY